MYRVLFISKNGWQQWFFFVLSHAIQVFFSWLSLLKKKSRHTKSRLVTNTFYKGIYSLFCPYYYCTCRCLFHFIWSYHIVVLLNTSQSLIHCCAALRATIFFANDHDADDDDHINSFHIPSRFLAYLYAWQWSSKHGGFFLFIGALTRTFFPKIFILTNFFEV